MTRNALFVVALAVFGCSSREHAPPAPAAPVPAPSSSPAPARQVPQEISVTSTSPQAVEAFRKGQVLLENARTDEAIVQFRKALELDPKFAQAHAYLGRVTSDAESLQHIEQAAALSEGLPAPERLQIEILVAGKRGEEDRVRMLRQRLSQIAPSYWRAAYWLGFQAFNDRNWDEAVAALRRALELNPENGEPYNELGYALAFQGKYDEAIAALKKYVEAKPGEPNPQDSLAEVMMMAGRFDEADKTFRQAAETPQFWSGWEGVAYTRFYRGDYVSGREALAKARAMAALVPDQLALDGLLAMSHLAAGDEATALKVIDAEEKEAQERGAAAQYADAALQRAFVLSEGGKQKEALLEIDKALDRADKAKLSGADLNRLRRTALGRQMWAQTRLHKMTDSDRTLAQILEEARKMQGSAVLQSLMHFGEGTQAWVRGDLKTAVAHLSQCLEDDYFCRWQLVLAEGKAGDEAAATAVRDKLLNQRRRDPMYLYVWSRLK